MSRKKSRSKRKKKTNKKRDIDIDTDSEILPPDDYLPVVFELPDLDDDIFEYDIDYQLSKNIEHPLSSLGFQHYLHQSKDKMEMVEHFKGKKKVYYIMHKFDRYIDNYDNDIGGASKSYFNIKSPNVTAKPNILSRAFYKLWELFFMFDLVQLNKKGFTSAHLAEGPGSFIQATMFYRDMFSKKNISKNDKYHAITIHPDDPYVQPIDSKFIAYYKKEKPQRIQLHKTYSREISRGSTRKDNGDLTNPKTIKLFGGKFDDKTIDFVTADGGFKWENENTQEQEAFRLLLAQIITALKIQAKGGNFICKFYETFTDLTIKLICMLSTFYKDLYIAKPLMSRKSNSERYIVCMGYNSKNKKKIKLLEDILKDIHKYKGKKHIINIFPEYIIPHDFSTSITKLNTTIANNQFIRINEMVDFVNKQNYIGEVYQERREMQINASQYWIKQYFPKKVEHDASHDNIIQLTENIIKNNNKKVNLLEKIIKD